MSLLFELFQMLLVEGTGEVVQVNVLSLSFHEWYDNELTTETKVIWVVKIERA